MGENLEARLGDRIIRCVLNVSGLLKSPVVRLQASAEITRSGCLRDTMDVSVYLGFPKMQVPLVIIHFAVMYEV